MASVCILLALAGCVTTVAPTGKTISGDTATGSVAASPAPNAPGVEGTVQPTPAPRPITRLQVIPSSLEINAPYSYGGYQSETQAGLSQQEVAGYPTTGQLFVSFLAEDGEPVAPAELVWTSSNPEFLVVDSNGWVRSVDPGAFGMGLVTVRLKHDPRISATASVTVRNDGKLHLELE